VPYQELYDFLWQELGKLLPANSRPSLGPVDIYQREDDPSHKQITFRFTIASYERTLTDTEVNKLLDASALAARDKYGAERV
jgi:phenylalanyl-tRNA synthetase beta subunit